MSDGIDHAGNADVSGMDYTDIDRAFDTALAKNAEPDDEARPLYDGQQYVGGHTPRLSKRERREIDRQERYGPLRAMSVMDGKPHLVPLLAKLGVPEAHAKTFTVGRAYNTVYRLMRNAMGAEPSARIGNHYKLFAMGVALDHVKTLSRAEAYQFVQLLDAKNSAMAR